MKKAQKWLAWLMSENFSPSNLSSSLTTWRQERRKKLVISGDNERKQLINVSKDKHPVGYGNGKITFWMIDRAATHKKTFHEQNFPNLFEFLWNFNSLYCVHIPNRLLRDDRKCFLSAFWTFSPKKRYKKHVCLFLVVGHISVILTIIL